MRPVLAASLALFALSAQATVLDFSGSACSDIADGSGSFQACFNGRYINQGYGDSAGADVSYKASSGSLNSMSLWISGYSGLTNVAYGDTNSAPSILIVPTAGNTVTLAGFNLGSYLSTRNSQVTVLDLAGGSPLVNTGPIAIDGTNAPYFSIDATSSAGFSITFGPDGYNVGIDNIAFTTAPIPEPGTWALMGLGLAAVAAVARRRQRN